MTRLGSTAQIDVADGRQLRFRPPPGAADILLVRHGESSAADPQAPFPMLDGHGNPGLHPVGAEQAERVAERLAGEPIAAIYVTPLRRTLLTALPLLGRLRMSPIVEPDLREVHLGDWEGNLYRQRVADGDPLAVRMVDEQRWDVVPNAEPMEAFSTRVRQGLDRIAAKHPDELVVVFTHGGVIGRALAEASGSQGFAFNGADNASISQLIIHGDRWTVRRFNDTAHVQPGFSATPEPLT